jgi:hypothetical protein
VTAADDALADAVVVALGAPVGAADALVVGDVDVGVSPPHAATRAKTERESLRMRRS